MHAFPDESSRRCLYLKTLRQELHRVEQGRYNLKVPRLLGLWDRRCDLPFHVTPEILFQLSGQTHFELPREKLTLRPCEVIILPRGVPHCASALDGVKPFRMLTGMFFPDGFSFDIVATLPRKEVIGSPPDRFRSNDHIRLARLLDDIVAAHEELRDPRHPQIRGLLMTYLALAIQRVEPAPEPHPEDPTLICRCRQTILSELDRPELSVVWLARKLGCSPDHLSRCFRKHSGTRLCRYIEECRLEQAAHLLANSDLKIAAIAWTCGFRSPSYFDRIFMKLRGTTPKAIREGSRARIPEQANAFP
jgi:AraC-like DNA-binding protein